MNVNAELGQMFPGDKRSPGELWQLVKDEYLRRNSFEEWRLLSWYVLLFSDAGNLGESKAELLKLLDALEAWRVACRAKPARWWQWRQRRAVRAERVRKMAALLRILVCMVSRVPTVRDEMLPPDVPTG